MAITAATRTDIIELVVLATGGAPGVTKLNSLVDTFEGSNSLVSVAAALTADASFKAKYPAFQTPEEFGAEFLDFILPGLDAAVKAEGVAAIASVLNGGGTRADVLVQAAAFLSALDTADPNFGSSASLFQNQVAVATYHTVELELDTDLDGALDGVTEDPSTVEDKQSTLDGTGASGTAYTEAQAAADAAITAATEAAAPVADAVAAYEAAAATAAETDAAALKAVSDASTAAAEAAATAKTAADAEVVTAQAALDAAIAAEDADAVSTANGTLIIKQAAAATAATNAETTAATAATDLAATQAAEAADAAAATAAEAVNTLSASLSASTAGADAVAAAAAAQAAADAYAAAAASTNTTSDDTAAAAAQAAAAASVTAAADASAAFDTAAASALATATAIAQAGLEATAAAALEAYNTAAATAAASLAAANTAKAASDAAATAANAAAASITDANAYVTAAAALKTAAATAAADAAAEKAAADALKVAADATTTTSDDAGATSAVATADANVSASAALVTAGASAESAAAALLPNFEAKSFVFTSGLDTFTGGSGNDTFTADDTQTTKVLSAGDSISGGAGTDSLTIYGTPNAIPQISGIENIEVDSMAAGGSANFASITGVETVTLDRAVGASTLSVGDGAAIVVSNNANAATAVTLTYGSTDTTGSLTLSKVSTNTGVAFTVNGTKLATLNINVQDSASTFGLWASGATLKTLNITGDQNLTFTDDLDGDVDVLDASALTGKLSVDSTNNAATQDDLTSSVDVTDLTIKGGSGADDIDVSNNLADNEITVDAGAGDDVVTIGTIAYTGSTSTRHADSIVGGDGTDILAVAGNINASNMSSIITGFETIRFTATAAGTDMDVNKLGITDFQIVGDNVDATISKVSANTTVTINNTGSDLTVSDLKTSGTSDTLTVTLVSNTATGGNVIANNHDIINIISNRAATDASTVVNELENGTSATSAATLNVSGDTELTIQSAALKASSTVDASNMTAKFTSTYSTTVKTYTGGSGTDALTLAAGNLTQGNTFAGGSGTDSLTTTATSAQNLGILTMTGFETLNLTSNAAAEDTVQADFRNVTDLTKIAVTAGDATDNFTLSRISSDTAISFGGSTGEIITTLNTGTSQSVSFTAAATVESFTLDSGATSLTVTSDDGDGTADEANGVFTALSGTSLATITVTGNDRLNLGTLGSTMKTVDASAAKGGLTVTASGSATTITGSQAADTITGGAAADTITGGKGGDTISGGGGADTYVFADTAANNGSDTLTVVAGSGGDILKFTAFMTGSVEQNGGAGTAIVAYTAASNADVNITNKLALYSNATEADIDTAAEIAALIEGAGDAFSLTSGGKTILITGDAASADDTARIWYIDDTLDGTSGTVSATDVVQVGTIATFDIDTLITSNIGLS